MADWRRNLSGVRILLTYSFLFLHLDHPLGCSCSFVHQASVMLEGITTEIHFGVPVGPVIHEEETSI